MTERPLEPRARDEQPVPAEQLSRDELRLDIAEIREDLGRTVDELTRRADVSARVQARRDELAERARQEWRRFGDAVQARAPRGEGGGGPCPAAPLGGPRGSGARLAVLSQAVAGRIARQPFPLSRREAAEELRATGPVGAGSEDAVGLV